MFIYCTFISTLTSGNTTCLLLLHIHLESFCHIYVHISTVSWQTTSVKTLHIVPSLSCQILSSMHLVLDDQFCWMKCWNELKYGSPTQTMPKYHTWYLKPHIIQIIFQYYITNSSGCTVYGLGLCGSLLDGIVRLNPSRAWKFVSCEHCVLSGRDLCVRLIICPGVLTRVVCLSVIIKPR